MARAARAGRPTVRSWLRDAAARLGKSRLFFGHGAHGPDEEAAWLLAHVLGVPFEDLARLAGTALAPSAREAADRLLEERVRSRRPLAYLLREAWLGEHRFYVDERAIVPRSFIAEVLRDGLETWLPDRRRVRRALDMCTGSGCLAVLLALQFPNARIDAVDISSDALAVARRNVRDYRLQKRVRLIRSDLFDALPRVRYDLIVANPPYVDAGAMSRLPSEYRHEPRLALAGGADGLRHVRRIVREAPAFLEPDGVLIAEVGHHRREVERAFPGTPFTWLETSAGDDIVFVARREELVREARGVATLVRTRRSGRNREA